MPSLTEAVPAPWPRLAHRSRQGLWLLRHGFGPELARSLRVRLASRTISLGLQLDLTAPVAIPRALVKLDVRPLRPDDDLSLLAVGRGEHGSDVQIRLALTRLLRAGVPTCWVAARAGGVVCYIQWLLAPEDAHYVVAEWGDLFPPLDRGDRLVEGAYTGNRHRGKGVMAHAVARVAAAAREAGARRVIGFVQRSNIPSLKMCKRAGFSPYLERVESWSLLRRRVSFRSLPPEMPFPFDTP